jgi:hypothetical protein
VKCLFDECLHVIVEITIKGFNHLKVYNSIFVTTLIVPISEGGLMMSVGN